MIGSGVNSHNAKVSILLSIYNGERTLERCIKSICNQTFRDIAIVCVNDCSTDKTLEILQSMKNQFPEIPFTIIQNNTNIGLTLSLNRGLEAIESTYTARIDADDWWEPTKIEKQVSFLDNNPDHGILGTNYINHSSQGLLKKITLPETHEAIDKTIFWRNPFAHSCVIYRTDIIKSLGCYNPKSPCSQDYELWVRSLPHTKLYNLQEFLCHRSLGSGISIDRQNDQMKLYLKILWKYLPLYHRPIFEYGAVLEPIIVLLMPQWIKNLKRRYIS